MTLTLRFSRALAGLSLMLAATACTVVPADPVAPAPAARARPSAFTPVTVSVVAPPVPVLGTDGRTHLAYELLLGNTLSQPATLEAIEVAAGDRRLLRLEGDALARWMRLLGGEFGQRSMGPGQQAMVWIDVPLAAGEAVPERFDHIVELRVAKPSPPLVPARLVERVAEVRVPTDPPVVIGAPLRGGGWVNGNSCCEVTPHRAAVNPIDGRFYAAERYGIDYVRMDAARRFFTGDIKAIGSYAFFGEAVHAVANGPVVGLQQAQPEQVPGANPDGLALHQYGGNYVVQDIGGGRYAFYAHLQPGNPSGLAVGQALRRGQVLGRLGNTGNSDAPHLHFHVMDSPEPLASNGLPFVFDAFEIEGRIASTAALERASGSGGPFEIDTTGAGRRERQMPLYLDVMRYEPR